MSCAAKKRPTSRLLRLTAVLLALVLSVTGWAWSAQADVLISRLPPGNAITDGKALLRYALPIDNKDIRDIQQVIEQTSDALRSRRLSSIGSSLTRVDRILSRSESALIPSVVTSKQDEARSLITEIQADVEAMRLAVDEGNKEAIWQKRSEILDKVGQIEQDMVQAFPFEVPSEYSNLPQLKGRATIALETTQGKIEMVVDGYNAPVTAGNFVDLVERKFYDGLPFTRAEDFYVVQVGDPPGAEDGFIDPATGKYRTIPLEVMVKGDKSPTYGITLEDAGRFLDQPVLPFSAYGTVAMARPGDDPNGGSSQFFFFLFEPELTPAGANLLDGRYSVFGYVIQGKEVLGKLRPGDQIISAKVIEGAENLVQPS
jgi:peptidylprolyl isomerase